MTNFNQKFQRERALEIRPQLRGRSVNSTDSIGVIDQINKMVTFFNDEYSYITTIGTNLLPMLDALGDDAMSIGGINFMGMEVNDINNIVAFLSNNNIVATYNYADDLYEAVSLNLETETIIDPDDEEISYTGYFIPNSDNIHNIYTALFLVDADNDSGFVNYNIPLSNIYNDATHEGLINTADLIGNILSKATCYAELSYIGNQALTAYNNSNQISVSDFISYSNVLLRGSNYSKDVGAMTQELSETISSCSDPVSLLNYLRTNMINAIPYSVTGGFKLTDNRFLVTRSIGSFLNEGSTTLISTIVSVAGIAIGGFFGAALAIGSTVFSAAKNAYNTISNSKTYVKYTGDFYGLYPYGYNQSNSFYPRSGVLYDLSQNSGVAAGDLPFAKLLVHEGQCEVRLREFSTDINILRQSFSINSEVITFTKTKAEVVNICLDSLAQSPYIPIRYANVDVETQDFNQRCQLLLSILVYMVYICSGTYNGKQTTIDLNNESDSLLLSIGQLLWLISEHPNDDLYTICLLLNGDMTWQILSGIGGTGTMGTSIHNIVTWLLSHDTWYQVNTTFCDGTMSMSDMMLESFKVFGNYYYFGTGYSIYFMPASDIIPPNFDANSWKTGLTFFIAKIIIISTAAFIAIKLAKNTVHAFNAKRAARVEQMHYNLVNNPTMSNALAYTKAVRRNNFVARFTNGTIFSQTSYWNSDGSTSDASVSNLLTFNKFKDIEDLIH